eukprot:Pgem_evm1s10096
MVTSVVGQFDDATDQELLKDTQKLNIAASSKNQNNTNADDFIDANEAKYYDAEHYIEGEDEEDEYGEDEYDAGYLAEG